MYSTARVAKLFQYLPTPYPHTPATLTCPARSELNKKISSASLCCLAGCGPQLTTLCVCPVLWKGQWQVLPTLPGLTRLVLVHCRDLRHLREVLRVVGTSPALRTLELHAASPAVAAWPGLAAEGGGGGGGGNNAAAGAAGAAAAAAGLNAAANALQNAGALPVVAGVGPGQVQAGQMLLGGVAGAVMGDGDDMDGDGDFPEPVGEVLEDNLYQGVLLAVVVDCGSSWLHVPRWTPHTLRVLLVLLLQS